MEDLLKTKSTEKHTFTLELSDSVIEQLYKKAGLVGLTPERLLEYFISDLIDGSYTNGTSKDGILRQWFERCEFSMSLKKTFLRYILMHDCLEDVVNWAENMEESRKMIKKTQEQLDTGIITLSNGITCTWKDLKYGDNSPCHSSKEDWEASEREFIEQIMNEEASCKERIMEIWEEYLCNTDIQASSLDDELDYVVEWYNKLQTRLGKYTY